MEGMISTNYGKHKNILHHKTNFYFGNTIRVYYCLYNNEAEYECITEEESKLYGIEISSYPWGKRLGPTPNPMKLMS